jgi:hypothetical protein
MAKIGIKLADGKFYPILDEYSSVGKKLVLTTVGDGQTSAQIDFYRNGTAAANGMEYIGTLVVEELAPKYAGETSIDLRVHSTADGRFFAEAFEIDGAGGTQKLEIDIAGLNRNGADVDGPGTGDDSGIVVVAKRRFNPIVPVIIAAIIFLVAALVFLFLFLSQGFPQPANVYAEPQIREEVLIVPPPVRDETVNILPPSPPALQNGGNSGNLSQASTVVPDTSRKALRTEIVQ